jgi:hypothetical protein
LCWGWIVYRVAPPLGEEISKVVSAPLETRAPRTELRVVGWSVGPAPETVDVPRPSGWPRRNRCALRTGARGMGRDAGTGTLFSEREERIRLLNRRSQREQRSEEDFGFGSCLCFLCDLPVPSPSPKTSAITDPTGAEHRERDGTRRSGRDMGPDSPQRGALLKNWVGTLELGIGDPF